MKCPKCSFINEPRVKQCGDCGVVFAGIRGGRGSEQRQIDLTCPFNDHGIVCGKPGSMSDTTNGAGPWYCSDHYWRLKGIRVQPMSHTDTDAEHMQKTREYLAYHGLDKAADETREEWLGRMRDFRNVRMKRIGNPLWDALHNVGPTQREPGED